VSIWSWLVVTWLAINGLASVAAIGKEREPMTSGWAVVLLCLVGGLIYCVFRAVGA
jgi:hypothetical protein